MSVSLFKKNEKNEYVSTIVTTENYRNKEQSNLMAMLEMVFTLRSFWHHHIESGMASPLSTFESSHVTDTCNDACPHCDGTL